MKKPKEQIRLELKFLPSEHIAYDTQLTPMIWMVVKYVEKKFLWRRWWVVNEVLIKGANKDKVLEDAERLGYKIENI